MSFQDEYALLLSMFVIDVITIKTRDDLFCFVFVGNQSVDECQWLVKAEARKQKLPQQKIIILC